VLALVQHRLGRHEQARAWLAKTRTWARQKQPREGEPPTGVLPLISWFEMQVWLHEAEAHIGRTPAPAVP
jgi:hypothetical protein